MEDSRRPPREPRDEIITSPARDRRRRLPRSLARSGISSELMAPLLLPLASDAPDGRVALDELHPNGKRRRTRAHAAVAAGVLPPPLFAIARSSPAAAAPAINPRGSAPASLRRARSSLIPIGLDLHLFLKEKREPCVGFLTPREPLAESLIDDARSRESKGGGGGGHRGSGETRSSSARVHLAPLRFREAFARDVSQALRRSICGC